MIISERRVDTEMFYKTKTPPKTNMSLKNGPFQKESSRPTIIFQGTW